MPDKKGIAILTAGAVLILSALLLFIHNRREDARAGQEAESLLAGVEAAIKEKSAETPAPDTPPEETEPPLDPNMPVVMIDGYEYVGQLEIPVLDLKLPVMAEWDYDRLMAAPCRQFGSTRTDDLVIAAHNYWNHFGRLKELKEGDAVSVTDMEGIVNDYLVARTETLYPDDVDSVQNSGYDLVLYTCTLGGRTRVTVFCDRAAESAEKDIPGGESK